MSISRGARLPLFLAGNVLFTAGLFVHAFLFNFYLRELGLSADVMGFQVAAITTGGLVALFPVGLAIDRIGVRAPLLAGVAATTVGLVATALARTPAAIYLAAAAIGVGGVCCRVSWGPALMRLTEVRRDRRALTWNAALMVGTGSLWTLLAGVLPQWSHDTHLVGGLSGTQLTLIGGAVLTALATFCYLPLVIPRPDAPPRAPSLIPPRATRFPLVVVAAWMVAAALVLPFFNVFFHDRFGLPVPRVGALFAGVHVVTALLLAAGAELPRRLGTRRTLIVWIALFAPALWALGLASSLTVAALLYFVQGIIGPASNPLIDQMLLEETPAEQHGIVYSWRNVGAEAAGAVGASIGGLLLGHTTSSTLFFVGAAVAAVTGVTLAATFGARSFAGIVPTRADA